MDSRDRKWRDKSIMWVFLIVLAGLALAYWPLVLVAIVTVGGWLLVDRLRHDGWWWARDPRDQVGKNS